MTDKNKPLKGEPNSNTRKYVVTRANYRSVVDELIEEAKERGEFDNLPGEGKPLDLDSNPYAGDNELSYKILKDNNFTLPWIMDRNELMDVIADYRERMKKQWDVHGPQLQAMMRGGQAPMAKSRWRALTSQWSTAIEAHNRRIDEVNMSIPVEHLKLHHLALDIELLRIGAENGITTSEDSFQ